MRILPGFILATATVLTLCTATVQTGCSCSSHNPADTQEVLGRKLATYQSNPFYERHLPEMPDGGCVKLKYRKIPSYRKEFNDSNHVHMAVAKRYGIKPIHSLKDAWNINAPLVYIKSCKEYYVEPLTHSYPYLVEDAADLLKEIGRRFNDSLEARGGGNYRIKVTSVLRTDKTIKKLKRVNINSVETSTHQMGTTFDISHFKYIFNKEDGKTPHRTADDLRALLSEILQDMRNQGMCYVKYEHKQSCYHITARPREEWYTTDTD